MQSNFNSTFSFKNNNYILINFRKGVTTEYVITYYGILINNL